MGSFSQFQSRSVPRPSIRWVKIYYSPLEIAQEIREKNLHVSVIFFKEILLYVRSLGDACMLAFRDPKTFVAGYLYGCPLAWEGISNAEPHLTFPVMFSSTRLRPS